MTKLHYWVMAVAQTWYPPRTNVSGNSGNTGSVGLEYNLNYLSLWDCRFLTPD